MTEQQKSGRPIPKYQWFTTVPEDWFALIVRGGDLHRVIHGVRGWYVDSNFRFQKEEKGETDIEKMSTISPLRALTGLEFVGVPGIQGLYQYKFAWNKYWRKMDAGKESPEYSIQAHEPEIVSFTPFESQYPLTFSGVEISAKERGKTKEKDSEEALIPVGFEMTVRIRMIDPKVALMTNVDWYGNVLVPNLQKGIKNFAGEKTYEQLVRGSKETVSQEFSEYIMGKNGDVNNKNTGIEIGKNILVNAGVQIIDVAITDIIPDKQYEEALLNLARTQQEALAKEVEAEGRKKAKILDAEAEATFIDKVADAESRRIEKTTLKVAGGWGDNATTIEKWRQIHGSGVTTYVEAGAKANVLVGPNGKPLS